MSFKPRATLPDTAYTLPARYYTDQTLFERELEVFYRSLWIGVARLEDLPVRGSWITRTVAGDNVLIVRQDGDAVRAFYNLCRHRGTQLCDAELRVARGEHAHVAELLEKAESLFETMGMSWHIEAARNLRRRY